MNTWFIAYFNFDTSLFTVRCMLFFPFILDTIDKGENGGPGGILTHDLGIMSPLLWDTKLQVHKMAAREGIEPSTG